MNSPYTIAAPDQRAAEPLCRTDPDAWSDPPQGFTRQAHETRMETAKVCTICPLLDACTRFSESRHDPGWILAGRWRAGPKAKPLPLTVCPRGHERSVANMRWEGDRVRCRACHRDEYQRSKLRKAG